MHDFDFVLMDVQIPEMAVCRDRELDRRRRSGASSFGGDQERGAASTLAVLVRAKPIHAGAP
jgi:hypothetical protein